MFEIKFDNLFYEVRNPNNICEKHTIYFDKISVATLNLRYYNGIPSIYSLQVDTNLANYKDVQVFVEKKFGIQGS